MVGGCSESHLGKVWICRQNGVFPLRLIFQPTVPIPTAALANRPARRIRPAGLARDHRAQQHCAVRPQTHLPGAVARLAAAAVDSRECTAKFAVIVTDYWLPDLCFLRFRTDAGTRQSLTGTVQSPTGAMKSPRGDHAVPNGDHTVPNGDHTVPNGDRAVPDGDYAAPDGDH